VIAIIGAGGQLGQEFCRLLGPTKAVALTHADVELTNAESIARALGPISPRVVINTAAFNHVDNAELRPLDAFQVNALGVWELARFCQDRQAILVHFSSDYVFGLDSARHRPYAESDMPGPVSVYGLSKLAGEHFVRAHCPNHFLIRTCGLYGLHGHGGKGRNFVQTMLRLGRERSEVRVVDDQTCTPTATSDLAEATVRLLDSDAFGTYHWTNSGSCTWYQFATQIFREAGLNVQCVPITSAQFGARATRPRYSALATDAYEGLGFPAPRAWQDALRDFVARVQSAGGRPV
jgi:dTDP-4-dehydrorhamnose reductase